MRSTDSAFRLPNGLGGVGVHRLRQCKGSDVYHKENCGNCGKKKPIKTLCFNRLSLV